MIYNRQRYAIFLAAAAAAAAAYIRNNKLFMETADEISVGRSVYPPEKSYYNTVRATFAFLCLDRSVGVAVLVVRPRAARSVWLLYTTLYDSIILPVLPPFHDIPRRQHDREWRLICSTNPHVSRRPSVHNTPSSSSSCVAIVRTTKIHHSRGPATNFDRCRSVYHLSSAATLTEIADQWNGDHPSWGCETRERFGNNNTTNARTHME